MCEYKITLLIFYSLALRKSHRDIAIHRHRERDTPTQTMTQKISQVQASTQKLVQKCRCCYTTSWCYMTRCRVMAQLRRKMSVSLAALPKNLYFASSSLLLSSLLLSALCRFVYKYVFSYKLMHTHTCKLQNTDSGTFSSRLAAL